MSKLNKILLVLVIILLVALVAVIFWKKILPQSYYAVYLQTGDLYFGKLSRFPKFALSDVFYLQRNANSTDTPYSLQRLDRVFWQPENKFYINPDKVVWTVKLKSGSEVVKFFAGANAATSTSNVSK